MVRVRLTLDLRWFIIANSYSENALLMLYERTEEMKKKVQTICEGHSLTKIKCCGQRSGFHISLFFFSSIEFLAGKCSHFIQYIAPTVLYITQSANNIIFS